MSTLLQTKSASPEIFTSVRVRRVGKGCFSSGRMWIGFVWKVGPPKVLPESPYVIRAIKDRYFVVRVGTVDIFVLQWIGGASLHR